MRSFRPDFQRWIMLCVAVTSIPFVVEPVCQAQVIGATVNGATATPIPGAGHDYIHLLSETVDPSSGQVSVRITLPMPPGRGLTIPFSITYDSGAVHRLDDYATGLLWISESFSTLPGKIPAQGGWSYAMLPVLATESWPTTIGSGSLLVNCAFYSDFTLVDAFGTGHNLGLGWVLTSGPGNNNQTTIGGTCGSTSTQGGDSQISAYLGGTTSGPGPVVVQDLNGTTYRFSGSGGLPTTVEDRNGNEITNAHSSNGFPLGYTDSAGRPVVSITGNGAAGTEDTVAVGGVSYKVDWVTKSASYSVLNHYIPPGGGIGCNSSSVPSVSDTQTVMSAIKLPNNTQYSFSYNNYGLLSQITYPGGGWVKYVWTTNPQTTGSQYSTLGSFSGTNGSQSFPNACLFQYTPPQISQRQVSFDGTNVALTQTFAPTTTWPSQSGANWTAKQNTVTTTDSVLTKSFTKTYTYTPIGTGGSPYVPQNVAGEMPLESTITTNDWNGTVIDQETKNWYNQFELACDVHDIKGDRTLLAGHFFQYTSGQISDDKEYDFGQSSTLVTACSTNPPAAPSATPRRETITAYQSFTNAYAVALGASLQFIEPLSIIVKGDGSAAAETDYVYGTGVTAVPGGPAVNHDETVYGATKTPDRGNAITMKRLCLYNCAQDSVTTITYDAAGQVTSVTNPCGNATCSDMPVGSLHKTTYSYADSNTSCSGSAPPNTPTDAYLSQVTSPNTNGISHAVNYCYDYTSGLLLSSTDVENSETTNYSYDDSLDRLTETDFPGGGKTSYCYNDTANQCANPMPAPALQTTTAITSSSNKVTATLFDGIGHAVATELTSDPYGTDTVTTTYDGEGNVYTVTNSYRGTTIPANSTTTQVHDPLGRIVQVTDAEGNSQWRCYNGVASISQPTVPNCVTRLGSAVGTWVDYTDVLGNHWQRVSDGLGRLHNVFEPNGASISPSLETDYTYNGLDDLIQVDQYGGLKGSSGYVERQRLFTYDSLSRLHTAANPESGTVTYTYDANSNVQAKSDARGVTVNYAYDGLNRLTSKMYSNDTSGTPLSCYQYDASFVGRLSNAWTVPSSGSCATTMPSSGFLASRSILAFDAVGRSKSIHQQTCVLTTCSGPSPYALTLNYDFAGDVTTLTNSAGAQNAPLTLTDYYDLAARPCLTTSSWASGFSPNVFQTNPSTSTPGYWPFGGLQNSFIGSSAATASTSCTTTPSSTINVQQSFDPLLRLTNFSATGQVP